MDKFNSFKKAEQEAKEKGSKQSGQKNTLPDMPKMNIPVGKEKKEQTSLMFTPSHKAKARRIAEKHDMSISELFGHWLDQYDEEQ
ncbi:hypothetical protein [Bacillus thuringiensis]|uniref:hypothetical protein n=1 Tax=Bacillus thuringiensis TaxID=1428 RepID=UPI000BFB3742|nr:hypothetical protein [Bacillus thuringiensis]PGU98942.1 hypothetical protein COD69_13460 [Bacillus thuringiensis]